MGRQLESPNDVRCSRSEHGELEAMICDMVVHATRKMRRMGVPLTTTGAYRIWKSSVVEQLTSNCHDTDIVGYCHDNDDAVRKLFRRLCPEWRQSLDSNHTGK